MVGTGFPNSALEKPISLTKFNWMVSQDEEDGDVCGDDSDAEDEDDDDEDDERKTAVAQDPSVSTPDKNKLLAQ